MIWHTEEELRELGPPKRKNVVWGIVGIPLFLAGLAVAVTNLVNGLSGKLLVVNILGLSLSAAWHDEPVGFVFAATFYVIAIGVLLFVLWAGALWVQHWLYYRRR